MFGHKVFALKPSESSTGCFGGSPGTYVTKFRLRSSPDAKLKTTVIVPQSSPLELVSGYGSLAFSRLSRESTGSRRDTGEKIPLQADDLAQGFPHTGHNGHARPGKGAESKCGKLMLFLIP